MKLCSLIIAACFGATAAFLSVCSVRVQHRCRPLSVQHESSTMVDNPLGLTPELLKITNAFESIGDDKLRYKQLLHMANQLEPMEACHQTEENRVKGCLSTVYVHAKPVSRDSKTVVQYTGDSDGLLTKGLVALLVRGLSGNTPEDIQKVDPSFVQKAGIATSLTPGRNNGFLNMLATMKKQALELEATGDAVDDATVSSNKSDRVYDDIIAALQQLQPQEIKLTDNSHLHANHAGAKDIEGTETHFDLYITSEAFEGLNLVKRHKLVYMILGEIMPKIHALQIKALTPQEASEI